MEFKKDNDLGRGDSALPYKESDMKKEEIKQHNEEIEWDIAAERYLRDNTSDTQIIEFCNAKINDLKARIIK